jgi:hypothetical protein
MTFNCHQLLHMREFVDRYALTHVITL